MSHRHDRFKPPTPALGPAGWRFNIAGVPGEAAGTAAAYRANNDGGACGNCGFLRGALARTFFSTDRGRGSINRVALVVVLIKLRFMPDAALLMLHA